MLVAFLGVACLRMKPDKHSKKRWRNRDRESENIRVLITLNMSPTKAETLVCSALYHILGTRMVACANQAQLLVPLDQGKPEASTPPAPRLPSFTI